MASKDTAKAKFVKNVGSSLAPAKMAAKLSKYLGVTVSESSGPVQQWKDIVQKHAEELFDKAYANMQAAYKG